MLFRRLVHFSNITYFWYREEDIFLLKNYILYI